MSHPISDAQFAELWNNTDNFPNIRSIANYTNQSYDAVKSRAKRIKVKIQLENLPLKLVDRSGTGTTQALIPEMRAQFFPEMTAQDLIEILRRVAFENPNQQISRDGFRAETGVSDSTWNRHFGTFHEFRRQAGLELSRSQHQLERNIARHVSADHYRDFNSRTELGAKYKRNHGTRLRTIVSGSDLHDIEIDPFYLRIFIEACRMVQPDIICLAGDIFDLPEFGKFAVDPREWDVVGRIKFVHENLLEPLREVCPNSQIDFVEGNHEFRLLRHLADATPALKAVLSDLLGLTVPMILGLDKYEVNYIARGDLAAFSKQDQHKEVEKSYVIYDETVLVHHHPHARNWGLPGWNGHHHAWKVFHEKNALTGAYQWVQLGCGHRLRASYAEGEYWSQGFNICHYNPSSKSVNHEYVNVTDMAIVGGTYFYREPKELIGEYSRRAV